MPTVTNKVIRYGRHELTCHEAEANGEILAGDVIVEENGGATVAPAPTATTQYDKIGIAIDDRERGMEIGDAYASGELVKYVFFSGGAGFNVNMADGNTLDPTSEERLVMSATNGRVRPFNADNAEDALFVAGYDDETSIAASGSEEPVPAEVV